MVSISMGRRRRQEGAKAASGSTGIPRAVQAKFEAASGLSFEDVRVHYNSSRPAQLGAYAYTQGSQVYIGPGQERHLEHELGHVVQQKRGLVKVDGYINGVPVNRDPGLERAANLGANQPVQGFWKSLGGVVQMCGGKPLDEWLEGNPELLEECRRRFKEAPGWWGIDPEQTPVFYRPPDEVKVIRCKPGESGGHHPHGLALGGPEGQTLTETGETRTSKNPMHTEVTTLQRRVIREIKKKKEDDK